MKAKVDGHYRVVKWIQDLEIQSGIKIPHHVGAFEIYQNPAIFRKHFERSYHGQFLGGLRAFVSSPDQVEKIQELLAIPLHTALTLPDDLHFSVSHVLQAYQKILKSTVNLVGDLVQKISTREDGVLVETKKGTLLSCNSLVLCSGSSTENFLSSHNLNNATGWSIKSSTESQDEGMVTVGNHSLSVLNQEVLLGGFVNQTEFDKTKYIIENLSGQTNLIKQIGVRVKTPKRLPVAGWISRTSKHQIGIICGLYKNGFQLVHPGVDRILATKGEADPWPEFQPKGYQLKENQNPI